MLLIFKMFSTKIEKLYDNLFKWNYSFLKIWRTYVKDAFLFNGYHNAVKIKQLIEVSLTDLKITI